MRIGLSGGGTTIERMVEQARSAEASGFTSLWYSGATAGDPLAAIGVIGRETSTIELGTSVVQTYPVHPLFQAQRAIGAATAAGRGFTLGVGPSHAPVIEGTYGMSYDHPGRHTEEYVTVLSDALEGRAIDFSGQDFRVRSAARPSGPPAPIPVLVSALGARLLRVAGELTSGTVCWMANARSIERHVSPRIRKAAAASGRGEPRIVAGLPVAVHTDVDEARQAAAEQFAMYGMLPNYRRILDIGEAPGPADAAVVGDEATVRAAIQGLFDAGATDVWAAIFPVGTDRAGSRARSRALLEELAAA